MVLVSIQVASLIILQFPRVQTFIVQKVTESVSSKLDGEIRIGKVYFVLFNKLIVNDISIVSTQSSPLLDSLKKNFGYSDTLLRCDKLSVSLDVESILKSKYKLNRVYLNGGEFNLQTEDNKRTNLDRIFRLSKDAPKDSSGGSLNLLANTLRLNDFRFTMRNHEKYLDRGDSTINFADLDVRDINVNISDIHLKSDTLYASINRIHGKDISGLTLENLSGKARICSTEALISDFYLTDSFSEINSDYFYMKYDSPKDMADFTGKVKMGIKLNGSYINFRTIGKFTPSLNKSTLAFNLNGEIAGTVDDLYTKNLLVTTESGKTFLNIDFTLDGLPDISRTTAFVKVNRSSTDFMEIAAIIGSVNGSSADSFIESLAPQSNFRFEGSLSGLLDDFAIDGIIHSDIGHADVDLRRQNGKGTGSRLSGYVVADEFDAGAFLSQNLLGKATFDAKFDLSVRQNGGIDMVFDTLRVSNLHFNGYDYKGIQVKGSYIGNCFDGSIVSSDPNLDFSYDGLFTFQKDLNASSRYDFKADLRRINLVALNFDKKSHVSELSFTSSAKFSNGQEDFINGVVEFKDVQYRGDRGLCNLGNIVVRSLNSSNIFTTTLNAPFARIEYSGPEPVNLFVNKMIDMTVASRLDNYFSRDTTVAYKNGQYNFNVHTFNTYDICKIFKKNLYIENNSRLDITIDHDNVLSGSLKSGRFALGKNYIKDFLLNINSDSRGTFATLFSENIRFAGMRMDSTSIGVVADSNRLTAEFHFRNDSTENNSASLFAQIGFKPLKTMEIDIFDGSQISLEGEQWRFSPARISYSDEEITIDAFNIYNEGQSFSMDGNISRYDYDSLDFRLNNFNVGIFNLFMTKSFNVQGLFSGNGVVSDLHRAPKVFFDITGKDVFVYGNEVGTLKMMSKWNDTDKEFMLYLKSNLKDRQTFIANGNYRPSDSFLNLNAKLEDLSVSYFEPFLSDIISKTSGALSGYLTLSGPLDKLALKGRDCRFHNLGFKINFTQVPYVIDGPFALNERGIVFNKLPFRDKYGSRGTIDGRLKYDYFRNPALDAVASFTNLQCLDTKEADNEYFYGSAFATGSLKLKGPFNNLSLDIDAVSNKRTSIHIPLSSSATASQTDLLTFVERDTVKWIDPYDTLSINRSVATKESSNFKVGVDIQVTPDAEVMIEIDKSVGDIIKAKGNGVIDLKIDPSRELFDIFGDYHVTDGSYHFVLAGLATRDFILEPGGTINFNGDITNTTFDLNAQYTTKTSINALIADTSSVSTRRTVNCILGMEGQMMNPNLTFQIDIPDLDPTTKIRVESALNTQGKMQKQFMAMLVTGGFIPDEQSGIANNSSMLYSNASEMLSNQINNIFHQLGIPLDLGLNYQPGEKGTDIFDVAVSTQLFNNRVIINGNIGNAPYAQNNKDVIGNLDVEVKLDNSGNVRLDLFSHAEDKYSTYADNNNSQRNGIGIVYQKEFNSFKSLLRGKSKAQKAYEKQERIKRKEQKRKEKENR